MRELLSREPDPAFAAEVGEECRRLLEMLPDESLRRVALLKLEGHTNEEIAGGFDCAPQTIGRWLSVIRGYWKSEMPSNR